MSQGQPPQYPSNVPPQNYPPQNYPPGNYPPGAYPPGAYPPGGAAPQRGTSVSSVFALIFGIIGCTGITALLAVLLGFIGISATKPGGKSGRPMAVIGLILGVLWLAGLGLFGGAIYKVIQYSRPARQAANLFITDLSNGNAAAAQARCTSDVSAKEIDALIAYVKPLGALRDVTSFGVNVNAQSGSPARTELAGAATFANGQKPFAMTLVQDPSGQFKITRVQFDPANPSTAGPSTSAPASGE